MRAKEGERGHRRGSGRREEEIVVERQGEEREVGSVTEQDQCTTRTLRVPPPFAHPSLPPPLRPCLTLTQRRSRRPPRVSFAALAQAVRRQRGREEDETGLEDGRREGETGLRGEAQIASCHSTALSATPTTYKRTSTPPSAADMQADAPPWPLTTANAL